MGFFDEYQDTSGGAFIGAEEKATLMENGVPLPVVGVVLEDDPFNKGEQRYVAHVLLADEAGEQAQRSIAFPHGTVESRDRMLAAMAKWLDDPANEPPVIKLEKVGRSIVIRKA